MENLNRGTRGINEIDALKFDQSFNLEVVADKAIRRVRELEGEQQHTFSGLRPVGDAESITGIRSMVAKIALAAPRAKATACRFGAIWAREKAPMRMAKKTNW